MTTGLGVMTVAVGAGVGVLFPHPTSAIQQDRRHESASLGQSDRDHRRSILSGNTLCARKSLEKHSVDGLGCDGEVPRRIQMPLVYETLYQRVTRCVKRLEKYGCGSRFCSGIVVGRRKRARLIGMRRQG